MILAVVFSTSGAFTQPIENTTWKAFWPSGEFFMYYRIGTDTIYISPDNLTYTAFSTSQIAGDEILINDLPGGDCPVSDTGTYTWSIQNDTLRFTLVSDLCAVRVSALTTFTFVRLVTGMPEDQSLLTLRLYPNPVRDRVFLVPQGPGTLTLQSAEGREIMNRKIDGTLVVLDASRLAKGIYLVKVEGEKGVMVGKLMKE